MNIRFNEFNFVKKGNICQKPQVSRDTQFGKNWKKRVNMQYEKITS